MSILPDRLQTLMVDQDVLTGIDFIEVKPNQRDLWIHFLKKPNELTGVLEEIKSGNISIYRTTDEGEKIHMNIPEVPHWPDAADEHQVVKVRTARPGDFGFYTLSFTHGRIDTYFSRVRFNFKVNCPSKVDCKPERSRCPEDGELDFPIDYQARDFFSLRRALMDFASLRYAHWADNGRTADLGVMLAEVMSALGDEHSYYQDRIAREAYLETASQRRSVRRLSRLVDYHLHDGLGASTWLDVRAKSKGVIYAGLRVWAVSDNGLRQYYSVGSCLHDYLIQKGFLVDQKINSLDPHIWDEDDTCLPVGATELYLKKNYRDELYPGKLVLLETHPEDDSVVIPKRRHLVRLTEVKKCDDPLFGEELTYLKWEDEQALPWPFDMQILNQAIDSRMKDFDRYGRKNSESFQKMMRPMKRFGCATFLRLWNGGARMRPFLISSACRERTGRILFTGVKPRSRRGRKSFCLKLGTMKLREHGKRTSISTFPATTTRAGGPGEEASWASIPRSITTNTFISMTEIGPGRSGTSG